jgi:ketosteroid isomerase-like protein
VSCRWAVILAITAIAPGILSAQSSYTMDSTAIAAAARAFSAAYVRNDTLALAQAYADSAIAFPANRDIVGPGAIARYFRWPQGYRQISHVLTIEHLQIAGDLAVDVGTWTSTGQREGKEATTASGRYMVAWVRASNGEWKILYDMWHPPPPRQ